MADDMHKSLYMTSNKFSEDLQQDSLCILCSPKSTKKLKLALENRSLYDQRRKIVRQNDESEFMVVPVTSNLKDFLLHDSELIKLMESCSATIQSIKYESKLSTENNRKSPRDVLITHIKELCHEHGLLISDNLIKDIPQKWDRHGDMILLPENCFTSNDWAQLGKDLWVTVCQALGGTRLCKKSVIINNDFRSPIINLLLGESGWVTHIDNGIKYSYDITKCMFSSGNITEKIRVGNFDCKGQTVLDLYAGIGYFVLPYLVKAKAKIVYACEWNPDAVKALKMNLDLNGVKDKCVVMEGDNRKFPFKNIADHVNLGLIPSSEQSWGIACSALNKDNGGWLHIHGNVTSLKNILSDDYQDITTCNRKIKKEWLEWCCYTANKIQILLNKETESNKWDVQVKHIEHVKSYAPRIDHLVLDVDCRPIKVNEN